MTSARDEALEQIANLARQHSLAIDEIAARLKGDEPPSAADNGAVTLKTLLGYLGGVFIFSGIGLLIRMIWNDMSSAQRVIVTLGPGLVAFILGALCLEDERFEKASGPLFLVAAFLQPFGMVVFLREYRPQSEDVLLSTMAISGVMLLQQAAGFVAWRRTSLGFFSILFWAIFISTAMDKMMIDSDEAAIALSVSLLCLSSAADRSRHRGIAPFWYFVGTAGLLGSFFDFVRGTRFELTYLGLNAFTIYLSVVLASRTVLVVSVLGLMTWLGWYTHEYLADIVGWPIALIALGMVMIWLSAYAVRMGRAIGTART